MEYYARSQPGELWHLLRPDTLTLETYCGREMGLNPKEKHTQERPKERICGMCQWMKVAKP